MQVSREYPRAFLSWLTCMMLLTPRHETQLMEDVLQGDDYALCQGWQCDKENQYVKVHRQSVSQR